jgi:hypothetical protein
MAHSAFILISGIFHLDVIHFAFEVVGSSTFMQ